MIRFSFDLSIAQGIIAAWRLLTFGFQNGWGLESKWIIGPNAGRRGFWGPRSFRSSPGTSSQCFNAAAAVFAVALPLAIFAEAGLSFLGIGITEPTASWGKMVGGSVKSSTVIINFHLALFPTLLVALTMLSFSCVGDGLQEAPDPSRGD